jgi:hypothetical protein
VWAIVEDEPLVIGYDGPYYLDFLMLTRAAVPDLPRTIADLMSVEPSVVLCPRCGGDGYVDWTDLDNLVRAGIPVGDWQPGSCRLCDGHGGVAADFSLYRDIGNTLREQRYQ